jgi:ubiquinone/menaquinone biosynthesis C-methylase UbiE
MGAAYDSFDYPAYWIGREYEHISEILAIKSFLTKIKKIKTILEIGAGFGRLASTYAFRAKKIILTDPSARTLKVARETFKPKTNFKYIHSSLETLPTKVRNGSIDLVIMIRVLHHLQSIDQAFKIVGKMLKPGGYFIFEFANKRHIKASLRNILKGNFSFLKDIETTDIRSKKAVKKGTLPFLNYHPDKIKAVLSEFGFEVIEKRSVSNIRSVRLKKIFATDILIFFERLLQIPFSFIDFGPSIFVLARKRG